MGREDDLRVPKLTAQQFNQGDHVDVIHTLDGIIDQQGLEAGTGVDLVQ